ncbi:hypothetical protein N5I18_25325, partial [Pseudomonas juntendi]|uniref:hypothetical protein n=4 Tax=Pseudomonas TaxID=286 RepID=UPI002447A21F
TPVSPDAIPVGAGLPAIGPVQAIHNQMKNKSTQRPDGAIGHAIRDIWRQGKCPVVIEQFRGVLV